MPPIKIEEIIVKVVDNNQEKRNLDMILKENLTDWCQIIEITTKTKMKMYSIINNLLKLGKIYVYSTYILQEIIITAFQIDSQ